MLRISNFGNPERFAKEKRREVSRLYDVRLGVSLFGKAYGFAKEKKTRGIASLRKVCQRKKARSVASLLSGYFQHLLHGLIRRHADGFLQIDFWKFVVQGIV
jgi:hypothetical protein